MINNITEILDGDKNITIYRKQFAELTGNPLSALLLQQIIYYQSLSKNGKTFYKFKEPCSHKSYKVDDSWCERLAWTSHQFDAALKVIGTKITGGTKRNDLIKIGYPKRQEEETNKSYHERFATALKHVVFYWTDSNRVTYYEVNSALLQKFLQHGLENKNHGLRFLAQNLNDTYVNLNPKDTYVNQKSEDTSLSETCSENTSKTLTAPSDFHEPISAQAPGDYTSLSGITPLLSQLEIEPDDFDENAVTLFDEGEEVGGAAGFKVDAVGTEEANDYTKFPSNLNEISDSGNSFADHDETLKKLQKTSTKANSNPRMSPLAIKIEQTIKPFTGKPPPLAKDLAAILNGVGLYDTATIPENMPEELYKDTLINIYNKSPDFKQFVQQVFAWRDYWKRVEFVATIANFDYIRGEQLGWIGYYAHEHPPEFIYAYYTIEEIEEDYIAGKYDIVERDRLLQANGYAK